MTPILLLLLLFQHPMIQLNVGESVSLKPLAPNQAFLPAGAAQTCVAIEGSILKAIWPGQCGINVLTRELDGSVTTSKYPIMFYVPSYQTTFLPLGTVDSTGGWQSLNVGHLSASDNLRSVAVDVNYRAGVVSGFNFALPATSTILGIEVVTEISSTNSGGIADLKVSLSGDGINYSVEQLRSHVGTGDAMRTYGGAMDLWSRAWTATEVNNLRVKIEGRSTVGGCRVDQLKAKVYYF